MAEPDNPKLNISLASALIRNGQKTEGAAALAKVKGQKLDAMTLNSAACLLADTDTQTSLAKELGERSVSAFEDQMKDVTLASLTDAQLKDVDQLGRAWDTVGWAAFRIGDFNTAEKYVNAAWLLNQSAEVADHLGQIYASQDKKAEAVHSYQLALAVTADLPETRDRLENSEAAASAVTIARCSCRGIPVTKTSPKKNYRNYAPRLFRSSNTTASISPSRPVQGCRIGLIRRCRW